MIKVMIPWDNYVSCGQGSVLGIFQCLPKLEFLVICININFNFEILQHNLDVSNSNGKVYLILKINVLSRLPHANSTRIKNLITKLNP